ATPDGRPLETDKHVYAQAFAIYGLAAHGRAAGDAGSLDAARRLFTLVEERARDPGTGSYGEAFDAAWRPVENRRFPAGGRVAGRAVGDEGLEARVAAVATAMARWAGEAGQARDGGWMTESRAEGSIDDDRVWWVQAEAVVGLVDAALRTGDAGLMARAERCW